MTYLEKRYIGFHLLRTFFEDLEAWQSVSFLAEISSTLTKQSYDDLLKGTAADIYIPLWASACLSGMDILLNDITLEVIRFYKKYGYQSVKMDSNPPDYIGEQFRFLEYLSRCAIAGDGEAKRAIDVFIDDFTLDTVRVMGKAMYEHTKHPEVMAVMTLAENCIIQKGFTIKETAVSAFDSFTWRRNPPLPVEPACQVSHASFNDCGNKCKMYSTVQEGCILAIGPDTEAEICFSGCPRGAGYRPTFLSSRRLRYPMERIGKRGEGRFQRISWDEAAKRVADTIKESHKYGPGSRYCMGGAGVCAILQGSELTRRLLALDGGYLGHYGSYSIGGAMEVLPRMFGQLKIANHEKQMLNSKLIILWGNNLVTTHFGNAQKKILMQAKEQGIRIIVIDPRQSDTALAAADQWIPIRPSTDCALADAMCQVIREHNLHNQDFINQHCLGFDEEHLPEGVPSGESYFSYLDGVKDGIRKTPEWASEITGIPAEVIHELAIEYATARYACIMPGLGPQRTLNGEQNYRGIMVLPCLIGSIAKPGGGVITNSRLATIKPKLPVAENAVKAEIPQFQWWRAVECPETMNEQRGLRGAEQLDIRVRYLFSIASGRLLNQHSDINHTLKLLQGDQIECVILTDVFMTPSARAADLLLPAPSFFETENICPPWSGEDYILYNHAAIAPLFESRLELDWLKAVAKDLGIETEFCDGKETVEDWLRFMWDDFREKVSEAPAFDEFRKKNLAIFHPDLPEITFSQNIEKGVPFQTPSGKIEIFWKELYDRRHPSIPGIPGYYPVEEGVSDQLRDIYPLQLFAWHSKRRCHTIHDGNLWLEELEPPCLWMNQTDARERGIEDGELVEVYNARGRVRLPVKVTKRIMTGVTAMSEGAWYTPDETGTDIRGSINVLTMSQKATPLGNSNPQHTNLVQVVRAERNKA